MSLRRKLLAVAGALLALGDAQAALADQTKPPSAIPRGTAATGKSVAAVVGGTVLAIEPEGVFISVGRDDHVLEGSEVVLLHAIEATHPVTKRKIRDFFPLGRMVVVKAGSRIAVARADSKLLARMMVGDEVELVSAERVFVDPWRVRATVPTAPSQPAIPRMAVGPTPEERIESEKRVAAEEAACLSWERTLSRPPAERIAIWEEFLKFYQDGPHAETIRKEIESLGAQLKSEDEAARMAAAAQGPDARSARSLARLETVATMHRGGPLVFLPPRRVYEGAPFEISFLVAQPTAVRSAWVHYRRAGERAYQRAELLPNGDGFLRQRIPGEAVRPPAVELFVSVLGDEGGEPKEVIGGIYDPERVDVDASAEDAPPAIKNRSRLTLFADYVDFDGPPRGDGKTGEWDQYYHFEADFMYRFHWPIYAMRIGFGTMHGTGGPKNIIDEDHDGHDCTVDGVYYCQEVGFNYAFTEFELRLTDTVAVMVRPMAGGSFRERRFEQTWYREYDTALGVRGRIRLGRETGTNLALGVSVTEGLGTVLEAAFTWDVMPPFPVVLGVQVTDQPVPRVSGADGVLIAEGDYGVRLIADVGWRGKRWFYPSARISYQARDLDHAGLSGGLAVNFDW
ncbi:MAG: hypothetical protein V2A73_22100 [Pseudomonadota bacterium]